ncbi:DUF4411 family protein [Aeromonas veronii]|uniref:DUF4411 family protein n=1 Tax=Aeromonas veronii TaxID=654 RepID=UPI002B488753|nr:DUF4411 family protein [Aeromonas veronii]
MKYLLDANTYIQAKNLYYHMEFCPAYWDWLDLQCQNGVIGSVGMIGRELRDGDDELAIWVAARPHHFINDTDEATQTNFAKIAQTVAAGHYNPANRDQFLAKADPWLIAKAMSIGAIVVTQEGLVNPSSTKVKVPNICREFQIPCINTYDLLREIKALFVLAT